MQSLSVIFNATWQSAPDARGDRQIYPAGWVGEIDDETAGYVVATGRASPVGAWPDQATLGVEMLQALIAEFRGRNIEPTQREVYAAIDVMVKHAAAAVAAAAPIPNATLPLPEAEPIPAATEPAVTVPLSDAATATAAAAAAAAAATPAPRRRR